MPFLLLLLLTLACLPEPQDRTAPPDWLGLQASILLTWLSVLVVAAVPGFLGVRARRKLAQQPACRPELLRRYGSWRFYHLLGLFAAYGLGLFVFGWGGVVSMRLANGRLGSMPGIELLILAPFLVGLVLSWTFFYGVEKTLHDADSADGARHFWSRWAYLSFYIRQNSALVVVPVLLMMAVKHLPRLLPDNGEDSQNIGVLLASTGALVVLAIMPWIMRLVLGLKPLADGPLTSRLQAISRRLNFRCNGVLLWNTRSGVANAMVVGIVPWIRYVVLTDRLIAEMTPDEVEAVFGHEVGHVKHRHMLYYMAFLVVSLGVVLEALSLLVAKLGTIWGELNDLVTRMSGGSSPEAWFAAHKDLCMLPLVALLGAYIFVVFGFVSRRCERQADIYGCRAVSCGANDCQGHELDVSCLSGGRGLCATGIRTFISALEKVATLNGISRDKPGWLQSWQHSTIARRVEFLQCVLADPGVERRFQRRVGALKWVLFLSLASLLMLFTFVWDKPVPSEGGKEQQQKHAGQFQARALASLTPQQTAGHTAPSE